MIVQYSNVSSLAWGAQSPSPAERGARAALLGAQAPAKLLRSARAPTATREGACAPRTFSPPAHVRSGCFCGGGLRPPTVTTGRRYSQPATQSLFVGGASSPASPPRLLRGAGSPAHSRGYSKVRRVGDPAYSVVGRMTPRDAEQAFRGVFRSFLLSGFRSQVSGFFFPVSNFTFRVSHFRFPS